MPEFFMRRAKKGDWKIMVPQGASISSLQICLDDLNILEQVFLQC
jgi:hypothetical protein